MTQEQQYLYYYSILKFSVGLLIQKDKHVKFKTQEIWLNNTDDALSQIAASLVGFVPGSKESNDLQAKINNPDCTLAKAYANAMDICGYEATELKNNPKNLKPVFTHIKLSNSTNVQETNSLCIPQATISIVKAAIFPIEETELNGKGLIEIQNKFLKELQSILDSNTTANFKYTAFTIVHLLKKHFWCVAAPSQNSYANLFEASKFLATTALLEYERLQKTSDENYPNVLLCADLSGVQKFIYDIHSSKAAKSLKGRSFYLGDLLNNLASQILDKLNLPWSNLVYSSGGKFYLLAPNTSNLTSELNDFEATLQQQIWETHKDALYICFGLVPFCFEANKKVKLQGWDEATDLSNLWQLASNSTADKKKKKFIDKILKDKTFFNPQSVPVPPQVCAVTGEVTDKLTNLDGEKDIKVLESVNNQAKLGRELKDATYLAHNNYKGTPYFKGGDQFVSFGSQTKDFDKLPESLVWRINGNDFLPEEMQADQGYGFTFYGGNRQPEKNIAENKTSIKTFDELAKHNTGTGFDKLGILRMDVDGLGDIFIRGFSNENKTFDNYATLSFQLDLLFSGYLNTVRNSDVFKDDVQILYSGGDDLFALGYWSKIIDFANRVQSDFKKYTGRPDITVSAGISIVSGKYPISLAAEEAGEAEEKAKNHYVGDKSNPTQQKNSVCIFNYPLNWDSEFEYVQKKKQDLVEKLRNDKISTGFLHFLQEVEISRVDAENQGKPHTWWWRAAYKIARMKKNDEDHNQWLSDLLDNLITNSGVPQNSNYKQTTLWAIAARWAEYEQRNNNKN